MPLYVGTFNFCVHIGDPFASLGIGWFSQNCGWGITFGILSGIAIFAAVLCLIGGVLGKSKYAEG